MDSNTRVSKMKKIFGRLSKPKANRPSNQIFDDPWSSGTYKHSFGNEYTYTWNDRDVRTYLERVYKNKGVSKACNEVKS